MPWVVLRGAVRELAEKLGVGQVLLSVADCRAFATARKPPDPFVEQVDRWYDAFYARIAVQAS